MAMSFASQILMWPISRSEECPGSNCRRRRSNSATKTTNSPTLWKSGRNPEIDAAFESAPLAPSWLTPTRGGASPAPASNCHRGGHWPAFAPFRALGHRRRPQSCRRPYCSSPEANLGAHRSTGAAGEVNGRTPWVVSYTIRLRLATLKLWRPLWHTDRKVLHLRRVRSDFRFGLPPTPPPQAAFERSQRRQLTSRRRRMSSECSPRVGLDRRPIGLANFRCRRRRGHLAYGIPAAVVMGHQNTHPATTHIATNWTGLWRAEGPPTRCIHMEPNWIKPSTLAPGTSQMTKFTAKFGPTRPSRRRTRFARSPPDRILCLSSIRSRLELEPFKMVR